MERTPCAVGLRPTRPRRRILRPAFTVLEMQMALLISALLFTALLTALDTMFKGYETNADAASSNVVTRLVVNRVLSLVRTGTDFRPLTDDVLDSNENPVYADFMEFVSQRDDDGVPTEAIRVEYRYPGEGPQYRVWGVGEPEPDLGFTPQGNGELWLVRTDLSTNVETESLLVGNVRQFLVTLRYDIGPNLERATIDITTEPQQPESVALSTDAPPQSLRMVASAMPRRIGG